MLLLTPYEQQAVEHAAREHKYVSFLFTHPSSQFWLHAGTMAVARDTSEAVAVVGVV
jgi:hypothetical protein